MASAIGQTAVTEYESDDHIRRRFEAAGQGHLFARWETRAEGARTKLLASLRELHLPWLEFLLEGAAAGGGDAQETWRLAPADVFAPTGEQRASLGALGDAELSTGSCACLTVAGGQGTRLGVSGPKGAFPITPIRRAPLFQVFAEKLLAAGNRYATAIPWYVMTSPLNHDETVAFFRQYDYFGLSSADVSFFAQGLNPVTDGDSKLLLAPDGAILLSPDGHGGVVKALRLAVRAEGFAARGLRHLFYCQVDNPLLAVPDPVFLGAHLQRQSQVSTKVVARQGPQEKMGVACLRAGVPQIVEYSDIDPEAAAATDANGALVLRYGSIAAHLFEIPDLFASEPHLPIHVAHKQQQVLVPADVGEHVQNQTVTKYEQFVFDAIPTCQHSLFLAVDRAEEFAPLKNSTGADSVATCIQGQSDKFRRWLSQCGIEVLATDSHAAPVLVEVAPLYADSVAELQIQLQNSARRSVTRIDENSLFE